MATAPGVVEPDAPRGAWRWLVGLFNSEVVWRRLILLGVLVRAWQVLFYKNPLDNLFSDPQRHWDNAQHFLNPGPMGAADPVFYQLALFILQKVTGESRTLIGLAVTLLSWSYPAGWYLFAREVLREKVSALRFTAVVALMPTFSFVYTLFMNETLLVPLLGFALWTTWRARRLLTFSAALWPVVLWLCATLTRSIALPFAIICLAWLGWAYRRRLAVLVCGVAIWVGGFTAAAQHSYPHFGVYSALGNFNQLLPIYFLSGAKTYKVHINNAYVYYFSSPSFYVSPFNPFPWETFRDHAGMWPNDTYEYSINKDRAGDDAREIRNELFVKNWRLLPRLVWENIVFLAWGHSWPESNTSTIPGLLCLGERWIWFPCILTAVLLCLRSLRRRGLEFFPVMTVLFVAALFSAHLAPTEGRYRKPIEPVVLLAIAWSLERFIDERRRARAPAEPPAPAPEAPPASTETPPEPTPETPPAPPETPPAATGGTQGA